MATSSQENKFLIQQDTDGRSKPNSVNSEVPDRKAPRVRISDRILKSAESYVPRAPRVDRPNYVTSFQARPDTIDETQSMLFSDGYYSNTGDLVDETSLSQYDIDWVEAKSPAIVKTKSGFCVPDTEEFREDIREEIRKMFPKFSPISERDDDVFGNGKIENKSSNPGILKENSPIYTSTPISYLDKSTGTIPKTPTRVHFNAVSTDLPQSRQMNSFENSGNTLDPKFSRPKGSSSSSSHPISHSSLSGSHLDRDTRTQGGMNAYITASPYTRRCQQRGITPTTLHAQNVTQELPNLDFPRPQRFSRKEKDPQTYDGSTDLEIYLQHFEWVAKYNHWTSAEKAQQLAISLKGDAQQVFRDLDPGSIREYDDIRRVLLQRFNPPGREAAYRCQFKNRKLIETESISDYGYALKHLSAKAYPELDRLARETYVIDQFICGLNSSEIRKHVQFRHPKSVDEAITLAIEYEAF